MLYCPILLHTIRWGYLSTKATLLKWRTKVRILLQNIHTLILLNLILLFTIISIIRSFIYLQWLWSYACLTNSIYIRVQIWNSLECAHPDQHHSALKVSERRYLRKLKNSCLHFVAIRQRKSLIHSLPLHPPPPFDKDHCAQHSELPRHISHSPNILYHLHRIYSHLVILPPYPSPLFCE